MRKLLMSMSMVGISASVYATIGTSDFGYGVVSKGMAGTGVAQAQDGFTATINPSGISFLDHDRADLGVSLFSPRRNYQANPVANSPFFVEPGRHNSGSNWFVVPNFAYVKKITSRFTTGVSFYGNGGMNTNYHTNGLGSGFFPGPNVGVFGVSQTGGELRQMFINIPFAYKVMPNFSVGASLVPVIETIKVTGLMNFSPFSNSPANFSDRFTYINVGLGTIVGSTIRITDPVTFGIGYQPKINPGKLRSYQGLFPNGRIEVPAKLTAGFNIKASKNVALNVDYQKIWYEDTRAFGNLNVCNPFSPSICLGPKNGSGFGFKNTNAIKLGGEWLYNEFWTFRAGYAYNNQPIRKSQVLLDIIAPAVTQNHITAGLTYNISDKQAVNLSFLYAPNASVTGTNPYNQAQSIKLAMYQYEAGASWTWKLS